MDAYKNLPLAARIAIPALLALIVAVLAYSMMLKPPPPIEVVSTRDVGVYNLAKTVLDRHSVDFHEEAVDEMFTLTVAPGDKSKASRVLAESGVKDTTGTVKKINCPAAPGFTATRAANERADNCAAAKAVQEMLLSAGAIGANVQVSQEENGTLLGPEKSMNVVAQVFLPPSMEDNWNSEAAARAIAGSVGTTIDRVYIGDDKLQTLFDGNAAAGKGSDTASSSLGLGCGDIAGATEVETKRAAVRNCYKESIGADLTELLGGSDRYVLSVEPTIDSVSSTTSTYKQSPGPESSRSEQTGSGQRALDKDTPPNTTETQSTDPAGDIKSLKISVILDKDSVTEDQRSAVLSLLSSHIEPKRGDPAPIVKMSQFGAGGGDKPTNEDLEAIKDEAAKATADPIAAAGRTVIQSEVPKWAMAMMAVLIIGVLTAVLVLWRKSTAMAGERERLEQSFRQEQRLFENYTQQNPDALAQDLNALFGAPSAPEPAQRF